MAGVFRFCAVIVAIIYKKKKKKCDRYFASRGCYRRFMQKCHKRNFGTQNFAKKMTRIDGNILITLLDQNFMVNLQKKLLR